MTTLHTSLTFTFWDGGWEGSLCCPDWPSTLWLKRSSNLSLLGCSSSRHILEFSFSAKAVKHGGVNIHTIKSLTSVVETQHVYEIWCDFLFFFGYKISLIVFISTILYRWLHKPPFWRISQYLIMGSLVLMGIHSSLTCCIVLMVFNDLRDWPESMLFR